ncbi:diaminopimelate decarboxylase [Pontibacillus yanchengensis]|uniref:Diaminopimelate decarboxylase n=2 Tax=Pontibacillus yanchengensis TaxID=462910 RepID=A0A6I4ZXJ6_9BACI|nr:diaminopimelate decarboxylase [Pontibacillus yanchengensis]MYL32680.1 diaminopimelate decarboxylase [Pontibacillus yanchengensis]MYL55074.1 diaminopimelate decarboxylase [Pontibacillus yanchengensis]
MNRTESNELGHLNIAGVDAVELANTYGTPLFVYDVEEIRKNAQRFVQTFKELGVQAQVAYASKAFSSVAMLQVAQQEGLSLDVVSQGEMHTAIQAEFPKERIHLHGNNKSVDELEMAIKEGIGCVVVDNFLEIELLKELLTKYNHQMDVLLRVTPGIEAHTHDYILTGQEDSKFGFDLWNGQAEQALLQLQANDHIQVKGLHCHIGSQIFETHGFVMAVKKLFEALGNWKEKHGYTPDVLNLGGGFGIKYTDEDEPLPLATYVKELVQEVKYQSMEYDFPLPEIWIEPGRAIVGDAGVTLYTVGAIKHIPDVRTYVSVDGGMTDNLRPALYHAKYEAAVANKMNAQLEQTVSIAGKCCESGDMLIWDVDVPALDSGDILATFSTGAYGYSMSNHYNRFPKSAVVFVENGHHQLVIQRESYQEVTRLDLSYERP